MRGTQEMHKSITLIDFIAEAPYCRPTVSTEDVARAPVYPTPNQLLLAYQYIDAHGRAYFIHPTATPSRSGEYLVSSWQRYYCQHKICYETIVQYGYDLFSCLSHPLQVLRLKSFKGEKYLILNHF